MPRKTTQKLRRDKLRRDKRKQRGRKTRGGAGASDYMIQAAGNMGEQVAGPNGMLAYRLPTMGGGSANVANQAAGLANALNNQSGGVGAPMAVPVVLMLANQFVPKMLRGGDPTTSPNYNTVNHTDPFQPEEEEADNQPQPEGTNDTEVTKVTEVTEGGMLGTIAVPAALVLASNYFGKRSRRAAPKQNRYTRKQGGSPTEYTWLNSE